jgi:transposase
MTKSTQSTSVIGGVDTHKDLHDAAVVDDMDQVLGTQSFATTRQGYKLMLTWMRSFGDLKRIGVECTGSYGAGLLRYLQGADVEVLEVTAPDKLDRRRRSKNDDFDAQSAAHAAFAGRRTVTPRSRDGMVKSLRLLKVCRKTAVQAGRVALQIIQTIRVCAPDRLRDLLRKMTRMQLIRTLAAWRPDLTGYRDVEEAYRIALKSLARRYLELHDEVADLDDMIEAIVKDLAPELIARSGVGFNSAAQLLLTSGDNPERLKSEASFAALQRCRLNLNHLTLPENKDFTALGDRLCFREKSKRFMWRQPSPCFFRQNRKTPIEPRGRPSSKQRTSHHRNRKTATGWSFTITAARAKPLAVDHQQWSTHCKSKSRNPISRSKSELKKRQILSKQWGVAQSQPHGVRGTRYASLTFCPRNRQQAR